MVQLVPGDSASVYTICRSEVIQHGLRWAIDCYCRATGGEESATEGWDDLWHVGKQWLTLSKVNKKALEGIKEEWSRLNLNYLLVFNKLTCIQIPLTYLCEGGGGGGRSGGGSGGTRVVCVCVCICLYTWKYTWYRSQCQVFSHVAFPLIFWDKDTWWG